MSFPGNRCAGLRQLAAMGPPPAPQTWRLTSEYTQGQTQMKHTRQQHKGTNSILNKPELSRHPIHRTSRELNPNPRAESGLISFSTGKTVTSSRHWINKHGWEEQKRACLQQWEGWSTEWIPAYLQYRWYSRLGWNRVSSLVGIKAVTSHYSRMSLAGQEMRLAVRRQSQHLKNPTQFHPERHRLPTTLFTAWVLALVRT